MEKRHLKRILPVLMGTFLFGFMALIHAGTAEAASVQQLENKVKMQQKQLDDQAATIQKLERSMAEIRGTGSAGEPAGGAIATRSDKYRVDFYGQINRAILYTRDGRDSNVYHVDNDNSATRIGLNAEAAPLSAFTAGVKMEFEFQSNDSNVVSQINKNGAGQNNFRKRQIDAFFRTEQYGEFRIGHGSTVSDGTSEVDLSATDVVGYSSVADLAGGHHFYRSITDDLTNSTVSDVYSNMDGLGRDDRIQYNSPEFFGAVGSLSHISGGGYDLAVRYGAKFGGFKLAAALAYADPRETPVNTIPGGRSYVLNGSASVLHDTGISATMAAGKTHFRTVGKDDAKFIYLKGGYQDTFFSVGKTALSMDFGFYYDVERNGDTGKTVGLMGVQYVDPWASEFYLGYRNYDLSRRNVGTDAVHAVMAGVRLKF